MNNAFNISEIKPFNIQELDGKTLKIIITEDENLILIAGKDIDTGVIYVISQKHKQRGNLTMKLEMLDLEKCFEEAKEKKALFVGVKIKMVGFEKPEVIINPIENFDEKIAYYKKVYKKNLTLKTFDGVKIIWFAYGNSYSEIESKLCCKNIIEELMDK